MIQAICFDLFHTLIDVADVPDSVGRYTADILGVDRTVWNDSCFSQYHEITKPTNHIDVIRKLAHSIDPEIPFELIQEAVSERQNRFDYALINVDETVLQVLQQLKERNVPIALISNASTAEVAAWNQSPMAKLFDVALFSCACGLAKPEQAIYQKAASELNTEPQCCLFVGDGGSDEHTGARNSGMIPVLLTRFIRASMEQGELGARRQKVEYEIHELNELFELIDSPD